MRKGLAGIKPEERRLDQFGEGLYSEAFTEQTYTELIGRGKASLKEGRSVILDATFTRAANREAAVNVAMEAGANIHFIECTTPEGRGLRPDRDGQDNGSLRPFTSTGL